MISSAVFFCFFLLLLLIGCVTGRRAALCWKLVAFHPAAVRGLHPLPIQKLRSRSGAFE